jgi:hypothetical protein
MPEPLTDPDDMRRYANALRLQSERRIEALTQRLVDGDIDLAEWQEDMKAELRRANLEQFVAGRGGIREGIKRTDYLRLGPELKKQYGYLRKFAAVIQKASSNANPLTFAVERAKLYGKSTQAMFWHSAVPVKLPQVPRDGKTRCRTNCKCRLVIRHERDPQGNIVAVLVYWKTGIAEHCQDCLKLSREWNPLRVEVDDEVEESGNGLLAQSIDLLLMEAPDLRPVEGEIYAMWGLVIEEEHPLVFDELWRCEVVNPN